MLELNLCPKKNYYFVKVRSITNKKKNSSIKFNEISFYSQLNWKQWYINYMIYKCYIIHQEKFYIINLTQPKFIMDEIAIYKEKNM